MKLIIAAAAACVLLLGSQCAIAYDVKGGASAPMARPVSDPAVQKFIDTYFPGGHPLVSRIPATHLYAKPGESLKANAEVLDLATSGVANLISGASTFEYASKCVLVCNEFYVINDKGSTKYHVMDSYVSREAQQQPSPESRQWGEWLKNVGYEMFKAYKADIIGSMQVNIIVGPQGRILYVAERGFAPGMDTQEKLVNSDTDAEIAQNMAQELKQSIGSLEGRAQLNFPNELGGKAVAFTLTFATDSAVLPFNDLAEIAIADKDEDTQRLIRIVGELYCSGFEEVANHIRSRIPERYREFHLGSHLAHVAIEDHFGGSGLEPSAGLRKITASVTPQVTQIMDKFLDKNQYAKAERFAKQIIIYECTRWGGKTSEDEIKELVAAAPNIPDLPKPFVTRRRLGDN